MQAYFNKIAIGLLLTHSIILKGMHKNDKAQDIAVACATIVSGLSLQKFVQNSDNVSLYSTKVEVDKKAAPIVQILHTESYGKQ